MTTGGNSPGTLAEATKTSRNSALASGPPFIAMEPKSHTTGEPVVWDLGSIAMNGGPEARALFRDVLVASASVPGLFPPVVIRVQEERALFEEVHVDGST